METKSNTSYGFISQLTSRNAISRCALAELRAVAICGATQGGGNEILMIFLNVEKTGHYRKALSFSGSRNKSERNCPFSTQNTVLPEKDYLRNILRTLSLPNSQFTTMSVKLLFSWRKKYELLLQYITLNCFHCLKIV